MDIPRTMPGPSRAGGCRRLGPRHRPGLCQPQDRGKRGQPSELPKSPGRQFRCQALIPGWLYAAMRTKFENIIGYVGSIWIITLPICTITNKGNHKDAYIGVKAVQCIFEVYHFTLRPDMNMRSWQMVTHSLSSELISSRSSKLPVVRSGSTESMSSETEEWETALDHGPTGETIFEMGSRVFRFRRYHWFLDLVSPCHLAG
mgnify:CR=1 FL=1